MLDHSQAMTMIRAVEAELVRRKEAAVIAVSDSYGELIGLLRVGDVALSSIAVAMNKAWTAARERQPTLEIGKAVRHPTSGFDITYYGDSRYVGWGGGIPVRRGGRVVGAIAVSGPADERVDIELAELGAGALEASPS